MIDFELAFINTEHPDFARLKRDLLPLITKALGVNPIPPLDTAPALVPAAAAASSSSAATTMSETVQVTDYHKITTPKVKISQVDSPPSKCSVQSDNNEESSGPFWQHWWGEQGGHKTQPKPRRGGRRSSFAIMDASELEAFRQSQFNPEPTSPVQSIRQLSHNKSIVAVTSEDTTLDLVKEMIKAYFSIVVRDITDKVLCGCVCV
jgi:hypothetical protein